VLCTFGVWICVEVGERCVAAQVSRCTKIINPNTDDAKYLINIKQIAKFVVGLGDKVAPTDIEEGMRVGYVFCSM